MSEVATAKPNPYGTHVDLEAIALVEGRFPGAVLGKDLDAIDPWFRLDPARLVEVCRFLRDDPATRFDILSLVSGVDYPADGRVDVVYHLDSTERRRWSIIKVWCDRADARVPSLVEVWRTADWQERETFDLMGVTFEGHPDLRRILCDDEWVGAPLRKDYEFPRTFRGIACETY